jgi:hypothetical protein
MKTRRIILSLGLVCFFATTGFANTADTTIKLLDIVVASNPYLKGLEYIPTFTVYNGTLFIINKDKLIQIYLKTGAVSLNKVVTDFLKKLPEDTNYVSQIRVTGNEYYLTIFKDLYRISTSGEVKKLYSMPRFFESINVSGDKLVVGSIETVDLINKDGKRLDTWPFPYLASARFIKGDKGAYYSSNEEDSVLEFKSVGETDLSINRYPPLAELGSIKEAWLSYASDKYLIVFNYLKRNAIYVIKKDTIKNTLYKTVAVKGANLTPTHQQVMDEEGSPNLEIGYSDNVYYILSIIKGKLKVLAFTV